MHIYTDENGIIIEFHGKEQFFALRAKVNVLYEVIVEANYQEKFQDWRKWEVRMPGTGLPNVLLAGSYWTEDGWDFLYVNNPRGMLKPIAENVLVITTTQERYRRLVLSCKRRDAEVLLAGLNQ